MSVLSNYAKKVGEVASNENFKPLGNLVEFLKEYPKVQLSAGRKAIIISNGVNEVQINLSKRVQVALESKQMTLGQLGGLTVAEVNNENWDAPSLILSVSAGERLDIDATKLTEAKVVIQRKELYDTAGWAL